MSQRLFFCFAVISVACASLVFRQTIKSFDSKNAGAYAEIDKLWRNKLILTCYDSTLRAPEDYVIIKNINGTQFAPFTLYKISFKASHFGTANDCVRERQIETASFSISADVVEECLQDVDGGFNRGLEVSVYDPTELFLENNFECQSEARGSVSRTTIDVAVEYSTYPEKFFPFASVEAEKTLVPVLDVGKILKREERGEKHMQLTCGAILPHQLLVPNFSELTREEFLTHDSVQYPRTLNRRPQSVVSFYLQPSAQNVFGATFFPDTAVNRLSGEVIGRRDPQNVDIPGSDWFEPSENPYCSQDGFWLESVAEEPWYSQLVEEDRPKQFSYSTSCLDGNAEIIIQSGTVPSQWRSNGQNASSESLSFFNPFVSDSNGRFSCQDYALIAVREGYDSRWPFGTRPKEPLHVLLHDGFSLFNIVSNDKTARDFQDTGYVVASLLMPHSRLVMQIPDPTLINPDAELLAQGILKSLSGSEISFRITDEIITTDMSGLSENITIHAVPTYDLIRAFYSEIALAALQYQRLDFKILGEQNPYETVRHFDCLSATEPRKVIYVSNGRCVPAKIKALASEKRFYCGSPFDYDLDRDGNMNPHSVDLKPGEKLEVGVLRHPTTGQSFTPVTCLWRVYVCASSLRKENTLVSEILTVSPRPAVEHQQRVQGLRFITNKTWFFSPDECPYFVTPPDFWIEKNFTFSKGESSTAVNGTATYHIRFPEREINNPDINVEEIWPSHFFSFMAIENFVKIRDVSSDRIFHNDKLYSHCACRRTPIHCSKNEYRKGQRKENFFLEAAFFEPAYVPLAQTRIFLTAGDRHLQNAESVFSFLAANLDREWRIGCSAFGKNLANPLKASEIILESICSSFDSPSANRRRLQSVTSQNVFPQPVVFFQRLNVSDEGERATINMDWYLMQAPNRDRIVTRIVCGNIPIDACAPPKESGFYLEIWTRYRRHSVLLEVTKDVDVYVFRELAAEKEVKNGFVISGTANPGNAPLGLYIPTQVKRDESADIESAAVYQTDPMNPAFVGGPEGLNGIRLRRSAVEVFVVNIPGIEYRFAQCGYGPDVSWQNRSQKIRSGIVQMRMDDQLEEDDLNPLLNLPDYAWFEERCRPRYKIQLRKSGDVVACFVEIDDDAAVNATDELPEPDPRSIENSDSEATVTNTSLQCPVPDVYLTEYRESGESPVSETACVKGVFVKENKLRLIEMSNLVGDESIQNSNHLQELLESSHNYIDVDLKRKLSDYNAFSNEEESETENKERRLESEELQAVREYCYHENQGVIYQPTMELDPLAKYSCRVQVMLPVSRQIFPINIPKTDVSHISAKCLYPPVTALWPKISSVLRANAELKITCETLHDETVERCPPSRNNSAFPVFSLWFIYSGSFVKTTAELAVFSDKKGDCHVSQKNVALGNGLVACTSVQTPSTWHKVEATIQPEFFFQYIPKVLGLSISFACCSGYKSLVQKAQQINNLNDMIPLLRKLAVEAADAATLNDSDEKQLQQQNQRTPPSIVEMNAIKKQEMIFAITMTSIATLIILLIFLLYYF